MQMNRTIQNNILAVFFLLPTAIFSAQLPTVVDYGTFPQIESGYYANINQNVWEMGGYSFNYAPELTTFFALLKRDYYIDTVVETGTFMGGTTNLFSMLFNQVHTIEIVESSYLRAVENFARHPHVKCHLGSSEIVLRKLLPTLIGSRVLFYLDAHWESHWPLLEELEEISKTHADNCIIVIDDFKVPGRGEIPYDAYGPHECSYEYIQNSLQKIYSSYSWHYVIPKSIHSRAKFVAIPKSWQNP
jgi:hypothetical protein